MKPVAFLWLVPVFAGVLAYYASARVESSRLDAPDPAGASISPPPVPAAPVPTSRREGSSPPAAPYDPQQFTDAVSHGGRASRIAAFAELLETLRPSAFPRVLEQVTRLPSDESDSFYLHLLFQAWQRADRAGAIAGLAAIPDSSSRRFAAMVLARAWARSDVAAARAWAEKNLSMAALMGFKRYADKLDGREETPKSSIEEILKNPDRKGRSSEIATLIRDRAKTAPLAAANLLKSIPEPDERRSAASALVNAWRDQDPTAAARWFLSPEAQQLGVSQTGFGHLVQSLAEQDPAATLDLLRSVDLTEEYARLHVQQLLSAMYEKDPKAVLELLQDPQFDRTDFPERYRVLAKHDPQLAFDQAVEKFRAAPDRRDQFHLRNGATFVVQELAKKEPARAANLAVTGPPELYPHLFGEIGAIWAKTDAAAATAWAAKLPAGQARDDASREFVFHWAKTDSTRSSAWLDAIPKGSSRDEAIFGFACATMDLDPDAALAWTRSMSNADRRGFALGRAWQMWSRENSAAAQDWLNNEPSLSDADREHIRTPR